MVRSGVVEGLDVVVNGDGNSTGGARDVAADHEHDAKFAEGMREGEGEAGDQARDGERQNYAVKGSPARCAERGGGGEEFAVDGGEGCSEGLHSEGKTVNDGTNDEAFEGERESVLGEILPPAPEWALRAKSDEQVETEDGGRKYERKRDDGLDQELPAAAGEGDPVRQRESEGEQGDGDDERQAQRQDESTSFHTERVMGNPKKGNGGKGQPKGVLSPAEMQVPRLPTLRSGRSG